MFGYTTTAGRPPPVCPHCGQTMVQAITFVSGTNYTNTVNPGEIQYSPRPHVNPPKKKRKNSPMPDSFKPGFHGRKY